MMTFIVYVRAMLGEHDCPYVFVRICGCIRLQFNLQWISFTGVLLYRNLESLNGGRNSINYPMNFIHVT